MHSSGHTKSQSGTRGGDIAFLSGQGMEETAVVVQGHCSHPNVQRTADGEWWWPHRPLLFLAAPRRSPLLLAGPRWPPLTPTCPRWPHRSPQALLTLYASFRFSALASVTGSCLPGLFTSTLSQASPSCWPVCLSTPTLLLCPTLTFPRQSQQLSHCCICPGSSTICPTATPCLFLL